MKAKKTPPFRFNPASSVDDNIDAFFRRLQIDHPEMTAILKAEMGKLIPLPEGQQRAGLRTRFNDAVAKRLDQTPVANPEAHQGQDDSLEHT